ncbi:hypothetical protein TNCV_3907121 [Trichonephila clavipes]|nr:hypothetical protein TNCV_3907121 [Trichonephila clavipes]
MVIKANDRRTTSPCHDEFRGPRSDYVRQGEAGGRERPNEDKTGVTSLGREGKSARREALTAPKRVRGAPKTQERGELLPIREIANAILPQNLSERGRSVEAPGSDKRLFFGGCWGEPLAAIRLFFRESGCEAPPAKRLIF